MLTRSLFCMKRARRANVVGSKISAVAKGENWYLVK